MNAEPDDLLERLRKETSARIDEAKRDQLKAELNALRAGADELQAENERLREQLAQRYDPIETALEAHLGVTEEERDSLRAQLQATAGVGQRLQEMASSGDLNRYVIQDCADALLGREGAPGSEFDALAKAVKEAGDD